jgi:hypothetical protein
MHIFQSNEDSLVMPKLPNFAKLIPISNYSNSNSPELKKKLTARQKHSIEKRTCTKQNRGVWERATGLNKLNQKLTTKVPR